MRCLAAHRQGIIFIMLPILLCPLLIPGVAWEESDDPSNKDKSIAQFAYCLITMACFWIFEVLPISVTALLPYILFPSLGLMNSSAVAAKYMSNTNLLLVGGFMVAIAIEETGLHKRIALGALKIVGSNPRCLMFGFIVVTWFLSMCIANTSTAALMIPIALSVLEELHEGEKKARKSVPDDDSFIAINDQVELAPDEIKQPISNSRQEQETSFEMDALEEKIEYERQRKMTGLSTKSQKSQSRSPIDVGLLLCVPFACSIGGTGTLTGTDLNLYLQGFHQDQYREYSNGNDSWTNGPDDGFMDITYTNWAQFALLPSFLILILAYIWMQAFYVGFNPIHWFGCFTEKNEGAKRVIDDAFRALGRMKQGEYIALTSFVLVVLLWVFRDPSEDLQGWKYLFPEENWMTDGMSVVFVAIFLFVLPKEPMKKNEPAVPILNWQVVQLRSSWGVLILIGGGYAIADASDASGFSDWVADGLASVVDQWEPWTICLLCSTMAALFTEITSNSASCALFVPLLNKLALRICVHPLYLTLPATIACSLSFMLPVATPPNAIAFGTGRLLTTDTLSAGAMPKLIGITMVNIFIAVFGPIVYNTGEYPCFAQYLSCCVAANNLQPDCPHPNVNTCSV